MYGVPVAIPVPRMGKAAAARELAVRQLGPGLQLTPGGFLGPGVGRVGAGSSSSSSSSISSGGGGERASRAQGKSQRARSTSPRGAGGHAHHHSHLRMAPSSLTGAHLANAPSEVRDGHDTTRALSRAFIVQPGVVDAVCAHFSPLLPRLKPIFLHYCRLGDAANPGYLAPARFLYLLRDIDALDARVTADAVAFQLSIIARDNAAVGAGGARAHGSGTASAPPPPTTPAATGPAPRLANYLVSALAGVACSMGLASASLGPTSNAATAGGNESTALGGGGGGASRASLSLDDFLEALVRVSELVRSAQRAHRSSSAASTGGGGGGGGGGGSSALSMSGDFGTASASGSVAGGSSASSVVGALGLGERSGLGGSRGGGMRSGSAPPATGSASDVAAALAFAGDFLARRVLPLIAMVQAEEAAGALATSPPVAAALAAHVPFLHRLFSWYVCYTPLDYGDASSRVVGSTAATAAPTEHALRTHMRQPGPSFGQGRGADAPISAAHPAHTSAGAGPPRLSLAALLALARDFELMPGLVSRADVSAAFFASARRAGTAGSSCNDAVPPATLAEALGAGGEAGSALRLTAPSTAASRAAASGPAYLTETPFLEALARLALQGFKDAGNAAQLHTPASKVVALIAWMASSKAIHGLEVADHTRGRTRGGWRVASSALVDKLAVLGGGGGEEQQRGCLLCPAPTD